MFRTDKFEIRTLDNSIFRVEFFNGADIELSDAMLINENLIRLSQGKKYCILLDAKNQFTTTPESREYVGSKERSIGRIAFAIVAKSMANKLVGNFFIQFNKPVTPTKLFSDEESAMKWLIEQKAIFDSSSK